MEWNGIVDVVWLAVGQYSVLHLARHLTPVIWQSGLSCIFLFMFFLHNLCFYFCAALYQQLGEKGSEMENDEYLSKKRADLQNRLHDACSSIHHIEIVSA